VPVFTGSDPVKAVSGGIQQAKEQGADVVILDTAGRLHVDEEMMEQLKRVRGAAKPHNVLLVLDAMTGQDAVNVADAFSKTIDFDGIVLTKLDGDARGGAALSVKAVTGKPIKLASTGEKVDQLEYFHPDRMASRILGMGDVLTLIERAEAAAEKDEQEEMERRLRQGRFTFDDFLQAYKMMRRMGPMKNVISMIPGLGKQLQGIDMDDRELGRVEAIVLSMTAEERSRPEIIKGSRRARIAAGSGTSVQQVNQLLNARKQMEKMMKQFGKGKMPNIQSIVAQQRR
jgi:signal recognition particle subunit SRP54